MGAGAFWLTDLFGQWLLRDLSRTVWLLWITAVSPAVTIVAYYKVLIKRWQAPKSGIAILWMLLGIWVLGPLFVAIGAIPHGGTFLDSDHLTEFFLLWLAFPLSTFVMSTYSGSLGGVLLVTFALLGISVREISSRFHRPSSAEGD